MVPSVKSVVSLLLSACAMVAIAERLGRLRAALLLDAPLISIASI